MTTDKERNRGGTKLSGSDEVYKGFLHLECVCCGNTHTFCAKHPMQVFKCGECGTITRLEKLVRAEQRCECGNFGSYHTNVQDEVFDLGCIECGAPVAMEWDAGRNRYLPCDEELKPKKKKRGRRR